MMFGSSLYIFGGLTQPRSVYYHRHAHHFLLLHSLPALPSANHPHHTHRPRVGVPNVLQYEISSKTWSSAPVCPRNLQASVSGVVNTSVSPVVVVAGGKDGHLLTNAVHMFDVEHGVWCDLPSLPFAMKTNSSVVWDNEIIVSGHKEGDDDVTHVLAFNIDTMAWRSLPPFPFGYFAGAVSIHRNLGGLVGVAVLRAGVEMRQLSSKSSNEWESLSLFERMRWTGCCVFSLPARSPVVESVRQSW